jgi:ribosome maturation factor RimP
MRAVPEIDHEVHSRLDELGYEAVEIRWGGSGRRPILKIRIDRQDTGIGSGVTVDECAKVSRALEAHLDEREELSSQYVLEVSSPGVDRPLVRSRDFERFRGEKVALSGKELLAGRSKRLEGELLGLEDTGSDEEIVRIRLPGGEEVGVPRSEIRKANLVFTWK